MPKGIANAPESVAASEVLVPIRPTAACPPRNGVANSKWVHDGQVRPGIEIRAEIGRQVHWNSADGNLARSGHIGAGQTVV